MRRLIFLTIIAVIVGILVVPTTALAQVEPVEQGCHVTCASCFCVYADGMVKGHIDLDTGSRDICGFKLRVWNSSTSSWDTVASEQLATPLTVTHAGNPNYFTWNTGVSPLDLSKTYQLDIKYGAVGGCPSSCTSDPCGSQTFTAGECVDPTACVPEAPAIALMSIGILALGAFVFLRRRSVVETVEIN